MSGAPAMNAQTGECKQWPMVPLGELVHIRGGGTPDRKKTAYWDGSIPWASVKDFKSTDLGSTQEAITELGVANSATNIIPAGTIIVPTRMAVGKAAINTIDLAINQDLKALTPDSNIDIRYLLHFLLSNRTSLERKAKGATVKGITLDVLRSMDVPLPPLAEQRRIAGILDKVEDIRRKQKSQLDAADQYLRALFLTLFGDPVTNPKGWDEINLEYLLDAIESGKSPRCEDRVPEQCEWGVLKLSAVTSGIFKPEKSKALTKIDSINPLYEVQKGDVLFSRKNTPHLIAATTYVHETRSKLLLPDLIFRLKIADTKIIHPIYLSYLLMERRQRREIQKLAGGSAGSMPNISKAKLRGVDIITPPLTEQRRFVTATKAVSVLKTKLQNQFEENQTLTRALAARAFNGEL